MMFMPDYEYVSVGSRLLDGETQRPIAYTEMTMSKREVVLGRHVVG